MEYNLKVGDKVKFDAEKQRYTVKAVSKRFAILTKPFNALKTVLYCIIDFERGVRGPNNLVFNSYDYKNQTDIDECLKDLEDRETVVEVSNRRSIPLDIEMIQGS